MIVTVGTTDFTLIGAVDNRVGVVFEATGAGSGNGTARRLNSQLGRIGGKLLADNLLRDGIDLAFKNTAYDTPVLYLKIDPEVKETVSAGSFALGIRYRIRTLGTTNFLLIGSLSNTVGTIFTATGPGTGTGTADTASDSIGDTDGADAVDPTSNQGAGSAVGFNTDTPAYDLDIDNDVKTTNAEATSQANISNIIINAAGYVSTTVGPLYVSPGGHDPIINFDRMTSDDLFFSDNVIGSFADADIELNPSGTGTVELESTTNISGDFNVTGSMIIDGDLTTPGSIAFGDSTFTAPSTGDTLDFNTFIRQDLNPGIDNEFNLGMPNNKWGELYAPDWTNIGNLRPSRVRVSDQQILDGVAMEIRSLQSNDDLILSPDTGVLYVEELKFENSDITNLNTSSPVQFASTGAGYLRFMGSNAFVIPAGDSSTRPSAPELGDTRWNTDEQYLECFDGSVYVIATGGGDEVTEEIMEELGNVYSLILG